MTAEAGGSLSMNINIAVIYAVTLQNNLLLSPL